MESQNFFEEDWDHILILDSARYDVFEDVFEDYFTGELQKRKSPASATPEWVHEIMEGRHNVNWFSSNPFINSTGKPLSAVGAVDYDTVPNRHVAHIEDLWDKAWSEENGTVLPEDVNKHFREKRPELADRRNVIHYMQPHLPFIGRGKGRINQLIQADILEDSGSNVLDKIGERIPGLVEKLEEREIVMKLAMYSSLDAKSMLEVLRNDSSEKMKEYHEENLRKVLEEAAKLVDDLDGKVVITSDHGEAFGEEGVWEHHVEKEVPELLEVPWLIVEDTVK